MMPSIECSNTNLSRSSVSRRVGDAHHLPQGRAYGAPSPITRQVKYTKAANTAVHSASPSNSRNEKLMLGKKGITGSARVGSVQMSLNHNGIYGTHRYSVFSDETEYPARRNPGSTTSGSDRKLSHLTNPNDVAAALNGGARADRGRARRRSHADGHFCMVARKKHGGRRPGEDLCAVELDRIVNLAATAATQP